MTDSNPRALRLGTRRSKLAMAQSGMVAEAVREVTGRPVELVEITTYGDTSREHLAQIGGTGVFVSALRDALLDGTIDFAVHSLKDLRHRRSLPSWRWPPCPSARTRATCWWRATV
ncbi:Porphobilinogen deaminase [Streptomyces rimosus subsp. rimosus]